MQRAATLFLSVALGGGLGLIAGQLASAADNAREPARQSDHPQLPNGFEMKDLSQTKQIREELAKVVDAAVTRDGFPKLIDNLAEENRDRYKDDYKKQDFGTVNGVIEKIHNDWKSKYGHDLDITKADNVFDDSYVIVQGVVTNANVAAANFPMPAVEKNADRERAELAAAREKGGSQAELVERDDLAKATGVALVKFPAMENLPDFTVSLIREKGEGWRVDVPLAPTSSQIHTQLSNQLTYFAKNPSQWPSDETQAYRMLSHRVAMALYNIHSPQDERNQQNQ